MCKSLILVSLSLALVLAGCAKKATAPPVVMGQTISGVVRVGTTPLANAAVGLSGAASASAFFEITSPPTDGVGVIRARRASEIATANIAAYNAMWNAGGTVVVTIAHALGSDTIQIGLGPPPTISVSSATFVVTQFIGPLNGNDFTALAH